MYFRFATSSRIPIKPLELVIHLNHWDGLEIITRVHKLTQHKLHNFSILNNLSLRLILFSTFMN